MLTRILALTVIALTLGLFLPKLTRADEFELDDGRRIEGTVVREIGELVIIKASDGEVITVRKSQIKDQRKTKTAFAEYLERKEKINEASLADHWALAKWCGAKKLDSQRTLHLKRVLDLNPGHVEARKALGFVLIAGDWYKEGSADAKKRQEEIDRPIVGTPVRKIPSEPGKRTPQKPTVTKVKPKSDSHAIQFKFDEKLDGNPPDVSLAYYRVRDLMRDMSKPMHFATTKPGAEIQDGYYMEVKIRTYFVGVNRFYTRAISNVYGGEAQLTLYEVTGGAKKAVAKIKKFKVPFTASLELPKEQAYGYAYYDTVHTLLEKLSRNPFFKNRGAKPYSFPRD